MSRNNSSKIPNLHRVVVISDDAELSAQVCASINKKGGYLTVLDGPRMHRQDFNNEIVRRNNVVVKLRPDYVILIGLSDSANNELVNSFKSIPTYKVSRIDEFKKLPIYKPKPADKVAFCSRNDLGIGLFHALKTGQELQIVNETNVRPISKYSSDHLVVCEDGEHLSQVIAANYAFSIGASLHIISECSEKKSTEILERLYGIYENLDVSVTEELSELREIVRRMAAIECIEKYRLITFITKELPYGFSFPEVPATHIFTYPDLGVAIFNAFFEEQKGREGIRVAALVDSGEVNASEIDSAISALKSRAVFIKGACSSGATVDYVSNLVELYPYDLLLISSHCGDDTGWRFTYDFIDSEKIARSLVVDIAVSISGVLIDGKYEVLEYMRFVSLDGVDWNDDEKKRKLYVGKAITDFTDREKSDPEFQLVKRENIGRVYGSSALKMYDGNYLSALHSIANNKSPIVINNACCSWHNLAKRFTFAGTRSYIGTLIDVTDFEAQEVVNQLFKKQFGKPLAIALWNAQNSVYGEKSRHPYVLVGPHFQRLRTTRDHTPEYILEKLKAASLNIKKTLNQANTSGKMSKESLFRRLQFIETEAQCIVEKYFKNS
jgi:hypothetical protein